MSNLSTQSTSIETAVLTIIKFNTGVTEQLNYIDAKINSLEVQKNKIKSDARKEKKELLIRTCNSLRLNKQVVLQIMKKQ